MGVISASGGACDLIADRAAAEDIEIPSSRRRTVDAITPVVPPFAAVRNPLDVTGYFLANRRTSALTAVDHALDAAVADPGLDFIVFTGLTLPDARPPDETRRRCSASAAAWLGERIASAPIPVITVAHTCVNVSDYGRELLRGHGVQMLGGIDLAMTAIGHALRWLENRGRPGLGDACRRGGPPGGPWAADGGDGPWSEAAARDLLAASGVPVVPGELVDVGGRGGGGGPEVRAGGRAEDLLGSDRPQVRHRRGGARRARRRRGPLRLRAGPRGRPDVAGARIDGVLVSPMRAGGVELIAGVTVDPTFGPVLAVGLGGVWVEVLATPACGCCPAGPGEVRRMLGELRGARCCAGPAAPARRPGRAGVGDQPAGRGRVSGWTARCARWKSTRCGWTETGSRRSTCSSSPRTPADGARCRSRDRQNGARHEAGRQR